MSKEKHIEEMLEAQCVYYGECEHCPVYPNDKDQEDKCRTGCRMLYEAGYRKQIEGEWIDADPNGHLYRFTCSLCGKTKLGRGTPYCPNCGAKMKGA